MKIWKKLVLAGNPNTDNKPGGERERSPQSRARHLTPGQFRGQKSETRAEVSLAEVMRNYERGERELEDREEETSSGENMVVVSLCGEKGTYYCLN